MEWDVYKDIRAFVDRKAPQEALELISETRDETANIRSFVACLEAACQEQRGDRTAALDILLRARSEPPADNFWVYHALAALHRNLGQTHPSCSPKMSPPPNRRGFPPPSTIIL
jgi:hypothetical protein